jgi:DNA-binding NtrC family response regulator
MEQTVTNLLLISDDVDLIADLREAMDESFEAHVAVADTVDEAQSLEQDREFDLMIADASIPDRNLPAYIGEATTRSLPTILIERDLVAERVLGALRLGVVDVLTYPVDYNHLAVVVEATLQGRREARKDFDRQQHLRSLVARMVRDRRNLRLRIDLLCKDLVPAYRRLAERVVHRDRQADPVAEPALTTLESALPKSDAVDC